MAAVRYFVSDVERAVEFYKSLGLKLKENLGPIAMMDLGGTEVWLSGPNTSGARPMPDGRKPEPGGWNRIVIQVDNIEGVVAAHKEVGTTFRNDVITGPGGSQVLIEDPDGNPVEIFQPRQH
jgi:catechol 2,3-dioxygenase-like lactoylglutathione lyase family enzyme